MKICAILILLLSCSLSVTFGEDIPSAPAVSVSEVGNIVCPVSGDKIKNVNKAVKHEYNGHIYNLCCKMCMKDFSKNPEKFAAAAEASLQH